MSIRHSPSHSTHCFALGVTCRYLQPLSVLLQSDSTRRAPNRLKRIMAVSASWEIGSVTSFENDKTISYRIRYTRSREGGEQVGGTLAWPDFFYIVSVSILLLTPCLPCHWLGSTYSILGLAGGCNAAFHLIRANR